MYYKTPYTPDELYHHGILKQKWGVRNGPPYPLSGGAYSPAEKKAIYTERKKRRNSIYNKRHFDETLKKGAELATLSYDPNRTKNVDMFYATHDKWDKHFYNAFFNKKLPIGSEKKVLKYRITNEAAKNVDIASEDSGANIFKDLYSKDRDFYNFISDKDRMRKMFVADKYKFKGYREAAKAIEKLDRGEKVSEEDVKTMYRMFNYLIPLENKDMINQRKKFFDAAKKEGYEAILDINDAIYGHFKARSPVIVIDPESIMLKNVARTTTGSKQVSRLAAVGRKVLGL